MNLLQSFLEALESLNSNKLRSGLTVLGIVIGVAAVIAMLAIGRGAEDAITGSISGIGTNLLFVFRGDFNGTMRNTKPLTLSDAQAIGDPFQAPSVQSVAPILQDNLVVSFGGESTTSEVVGVTPEYFAVRNYLISEGEYITEEHMLGRASVVLIGPDVADELFGRVDGITGETVRIEGQPFRVLGVLESKGGGLFGSEDNRVILPFNTAQVRLIRRRTNEIVDIILVQALDAELVDSAIEEITQILNTRHRTPIGENDFTVFTQRDLLNTFESITGILTIFLGGIAGISLLVGGIGIMNIMLVSVTERTREIGLRKALGARKRDILIQFLTESSLLSFIGGIIGIILGWLIAFLVGQIAAAANTDFTPVVASDAVLLATLFSAAVGLFFGIYPASRAANLEPVEALRYE
ncbi:MAG: ABC transporter permease [Anaerolineae bacterium]|nr:ABC transporter permease [Anaerolineae bacterium]MDK1081693.1 ABC transporter permease [Anaerolineae bacterium]MDK1117369.1 ABC transporter permease [Anaerolineae bacterium]